MYEKVNLYHPDKVADRIAGAIVDLAYKKSQNPKIAVEVLIGHGHANIIIETSANISANEVFDITKRIIPDVEGANINIVPQDQHLADNQKDGLRCGDNGIFKGCITTEEQFTLTNLVQCLADEYQSDGKYIADENSIIVCQSNMDNFHKDSLMKWLKQSKYTNVKINPLGEWTGGYNVDCGATNRKLGSDMGDAVTGGGLHGKDLSKADVSVNIVCHLLAEERHTEVTAFCAIGDKYIDFHIGGFIVITLSYSSVVERAMEYVNGIGGFEKLAEWGLIR